MTEAAGHVACTLTSCEKGRVAGAEGLIEEKFCSTSCRGRPGVQFGSSIVYANAASRAVVRPLIQVPLRGATTSIAWVLRNAVRVNWCKCVLSCRESGVQASEKRVGYMDGWMRAFRLVSSRIIAYCLVSFRPGPGRDSYGRESSNGGIGRRLEANIPVPGARRLYGDGNAGRAGIRAGQGRAGYAAVVCSGIVGSSTRRNNGGGSV